MPGVEAILRTDAVRDGKASNNLTPQYASVSFSASADLVALVSGSRIRVLGLVLLASAGSTTIQITDGTNSVNLTGAMSVIVGVPLVLPINPLGWFQTAIGGKLSVVEVGSAQVSGALVYVLPAV